MRYDGELLSKFQEIFEIAVAARKKGLDPSLEPECSVTVDLGERVEKALGLTGIAARIRELKKLLSREEVAFKIAEEVVLANPTANPERAAEQSIRAAAAVLDEGVTVAPIQGISGVKIKANADGTRYLAIYFAGPIRSAGGTDMGLIVVAADYVRQLLGLDRYKATQAEAARFVEELRLYEREVSRFQFRFSDEEVQNAIMRLPVEVTGVETDQVEVAVFRDLPRVETNRVRGGALLVVNDGLLGRAQKITKVIEKLGIQDWDWLRGATALNAWAEEAPELKYMEDVIAGRPVFSLPRMRGGFRLRYGRARNTGLAAVGIHPATMEILRGFIAIGTQLKLEGPGKAGIASPVDSIEPPIVKLKDGSVIQVSKAKEAKALLDSIEESLFLGDMLISFGEFLENNRPLQPTGYVEEYWAEELRQAIAAIYQSVDEFCSKAGMDPKRIKAFIDHPLSHRPSFEEAMKISRLLDIPMHPTYTYFWENLEPHEFIYLREKLVGARYQGEGTMAVNNEPRIKHILEKACIPHRLIDGKIALEGVHAKVISTLLKLDGEGLSVKSASVLEAIKELSGIAVRRKAGAYVGARMGRPEKAKQRAMKPPVHGLFPVGLVGGSRRNIVEAAKRDGIADVKVAVRLCRSCGKESFSPLCNTCGQPTAIRLHCPKCGKALAGDTCVSCKLQGVPYGRRRIYVKELLEGALDRLRMERPPEVVKCVRELVSDGKVPEALEKGILRAKHGLSVFKDGTIRFDVTNATLTHFKPKEIGVSVEKLKELGYYQDIKGEPLNNPSQTCALKAQDVIIPEACGLHLLSVAKFIDELLVRVYGLRPYYNASAKEDLVGKLIVGISPHTSVGVVGRIIGFTKASVCYAHPVWHAAKRRNCDGDEDSVCLALDVLLNFSKAYLSLKSGGLMGVPLLLSVILQPSEVAREAFSIEVVERYPLPFFEETLKGSDPRSVAGFIETLGHRLTAGGGPDPIGFTHDTSDINEGNVESSYKRLRTMMDKSEEQLKLAETLRAVVASDVARRVLSTHLMRDLTGNLKAFATQRFRCTHCGVKYRRVPLKGVCPKCGGKLSLTVFRGMVEKYLSTAQRMVDRYMLGPYNKQRLQLIRMEIDSLFMDEEAQKKRPSLKDFL